MGDTLRRPCYLSWVDHDRNIRCRKQETDIRKYYFVNRTIQIVNQLPADAIGTFPVKKLILVKKLINKAK
jgi:hypothetical protein